ncbi:MAG: primosomal protein N' [Polyangiaceae bacterium]|nr:primosomal protein N' [Polyangiaceae bacterium]
MGARGGGAPRPAAEAPGGAPRPVVEVPGGAAPDRCVRVALPVPLGRTFTYRAAASLDVRRGSRVWVELGRRPVLGVVLEVDSGPGDVEPARIKPIRAVVEAEPVVPEELLELLVELARYYLAPLGDVLRLALPAVERARREELRRAGVEGSERIAAVGRVARRVVAVEDPRGLDVVRGQARDLLAWLREAGPREVVAVASRLSNGRRALERLVELGLVRVEHVEALADPFFSEPVERDVPPELTVAQRDAFAAIARAIDAGGPAAFLLQGVTGSGKTEVYVRAAERALAGGRDTLVLVPEIALTPQLVGRFRARLGDGIAVLHSALGEGERHAMWKRIRSGELRVVVGARSALFAPLQRLGLVCVDEEHDASFKQEDGVRYHARDMALLRAHRAGAVAVLGSATPSLGSLALAEQGRLERLVLPSRARSGAALPSVEVVDLRRMGPGPSGERLLTLPLHRALEAVLRDRQQAILFLNRRGFAPGIVCEACGEVVVCPSCDVPLTAHRTPRPEARCHYCDHRAPAPEACPSCGASALTLEGAGTERIQEALERSFPAARIARLDRDVAGGKRSERVLERMRSGEVDLLVGTQMVAKGHDLPNVTLVGVLNADAALALPDFRAAERTFQLLVQVAGRAGRGGVPGRVLVQTRNPEHPAIACAVRHDAASFVAHELADRRELGYPPFGRLAAVRLDAVDAGRAEREAQRLAAIAREHAPVGAVLGPAPAPLARLRGRHRFRFLLRCRDRAAMRPALLAVARAGHDPVVRVAIDVDPASLL